MKLISIAYIIIGIFVAVVGIACIFRAFGDGDVIGFLLSWLIMISGIILACGGVFKD